LRDHLARKGRLVRASALLLMQSDHVEPHHGDVNKFWLGPFQSLCKGCHESTKRMVETRGFRPDIGLDGWPLDPNHPVYRTR
jgi:5-methylcytosine-specific restriction enzyme A